MKKRRTFKKQYELYNQSGGAGAKGERLKEKKQESLLKKQTGAGGLEKENAPLTSFFYTLNYSFSHIFSGRTI